MKSGGEDLYLINSEPPELCVAHVRDGRLFDLFIERGGRLLGDIFKGRVENVLPGMDAAFVNVGLSRNALLYAGDCIAGVSSAIGTGSQETISNLVKVGDEVLVQIARPPVGTKGARVNMRLSLAGRYVVLTTHSEGVGVSRRIESEDERNRLRRIAEKVRPLDHGLIIRTEGEQVSEGEIARDVRELSQQLHSIRERAASAPVPSVVHREMGLLGRIVRDQLSHRTGRVMVDSPEVLETLHKLTSFIAPHLQDRVQLYQEAEPIFQKYGIARDIERAQQRIVPLSSGGEIVFDEAEALCAIDVNTGKFTGKKKLAETVLQTNLEAVDEATRQIRLRDISGVIVIDFIDMERRRDSVKVLDALEAALKQDRARVRIVQLSPSGLVEVIRRREGQSLSQIMHRSCPYCSGTGEINSPLTTALAARRRVREVAAKAEFGARNYIVVWLHPEAALAFLGAENEYVHALEEATNTLVQLRAVPDSHMEYFRVEMAAPEYDSPKWVAGQVLNLSPNALMLPAKEPRYVVMDDSLIAFTAPKSGSSPAPGARRPATIKISEPEPASNNRWYYHAEVLTWHEAQA